VFAAPYARLVAPVEGSNDLAWVMFGAFVFSVLALLGVGATAVRKSARLSRAQERARAAQQLAHERLHDPLTGLPTRTLFLDRLDTALSRAERSARPLAVMFADVDAFKRINDSLGHAAGDRLLADLAHRLTDTVRPQDTVSRFGGDEFLVLCDELAEEEDVLRIAGRVRAALERPFELDGRQIHVSCCIGIAIHGVVARATDADTLVRDADAAMYRAKAKGPGRLRVFDAELHAEALRRLDVEEALRSAVARRELFVHYQPIVSLPAGSVWGVEALARWHRAGEGLVPPPEFIALAEECGLIHQIGADVLDQALRDTAEWSAAELLPEGFVLSVNISPQQLADPGFANDVARRLRDWPLHPSSLCLEITESAVAADPAAGSAAVSALAELGVSVAIDDFGVGMSSFSQLVRSPVVDIVKLDRSFVVDIDDPRKRSAVAAIATMAGGLGMAAIAEGVEREAQATQLHDLGYQLAQGYRFGRPMEAEAMRRRLAAAPSATPAAAPAS
jgi:diguanylate cyclase (GGDEF)-like protein